LTHPGRTAHDPQNLFLIGQRKVRPSADQQIKGPCAGYVGFYVACLRKPRISRGKRYRFDSRRLH